MNFGLQLYTVRDHLERDFKGTIQQVASMGYHGIEFAGYGGLAASELKQLCEQYQITPISSHVGLHLLEKSENELDYAKELGLSYVVCPWLPMERRQSIADYIQLAKTLNHIGEQCAKRDLIFAYHNHSFEFDLQDDMGRYALDVLFENTDPSLVKVELDMFWIEYSGLSIDSYIDRYNGRLPLLHLKDLAHGDERKDTSLGEGKLDIRGIIQHASEAFTSWFFVEQDHPQGDSMEVAKKGIDYLLSTTNA